MSRGRRAAIMACPGGGLNSHGLPLRWRSRRQGRPAGGHARHHPRAGGHSLRGSPAVKTALELCRRVSSFPRRAHRPKASRRDLFGDSSTSMMFALGSATRERKNARIASRMTDREGRAACARRESVAKTARGARAPLASVDAIEAAVTMTSTRPARERELFADCVFRQSRARWCICLCGTRSEHDSLCPKDTPGAASARRRRGEGRWAAASLCRMQMPESRCAEGGPHHPIAA